jgi:hypothetical protein
MCDAPDRQADYSCEKRPKVCPAASASSLSCRSPGTAIYSSSYIQSTSFWQFIPRNMRPTKDLRRRLSKVHNLGVLTNLGLLIFNICDINAVLISQIVEQIQVLFSQLPLLLVPENQINPKIQMLTYILRLQLTSVCHDVVVGVAPPN